MKFKSRTLTPGWNLFGNTPETVPLKTNPAPGAPKDDIRLSAAWQRYLSQVNPKEGYRFIMIPRSGWLNKNSNADTLGFGGNVVEIIEEARNGMARIKTFNVNDAPPASSWNYETRPELVHKFTVITRNGGIQNPQNGIDSYNIVIGRGPLYVEMSRIEYFPMLPFEAVVGATTLPWLRVREHPDLKSAVAGNLKPLERVEVLEYAPRGGSVWGRTAQGWIALAWFPAGSRPRFYTNWRMATLPPPPPRMKLGA
jgi:hypothetical protein